LEIYVDAREGTAQQDPTGGIMTTAPDVSAKLREPELSGQIVVVIGGSAGIGLETARRARAIGAGVILTGRNPERLERAAAELGALSSAASTPPIRPLSIGSSRICQSGSTT
jgi:threonine dehydrogenase-like Zn-dependent dehydrogenase